MGRFALCFGLAIVASFAHAQYSTEVYQYPSDSGRFGRASGSSNINQVGWESSNGVAHATIWNNTFSSVIDLNPSGAVNSSLMATSSSGEYQGGYANFEEPSGSNGKVGYWHGTANSFVDLTPTTFDLTYITGISDTCQVGWALTPDNFDQHAIMWRGTAASVIDLNPDGYYFSIAYGTSNETQVGYGSLIDLGGERPLLWHGSASSAVDLTPTGYTGGRAFAASGDQQVGYAFVGYDVHAMIWRGSATDFTDVHPVGWESSSLSAINGRFQVGSAYKVDPSGNPLGINHAMLWEGSAESVTDLDTFLPTGYIGSYAIGVSENGTVFGYAEDSDYINHPVIWTPVPEPSSVVAMISGVGLFAFRRKKR